MLPLPPKNQSISSYGEKQIWERERMGILVSLGWIRMFYLDLRFEDSAGNEGRKQVMYCLPVEDKGIPGIGSSKYKCCTESERVAKKPVQWSIGINKRAMRSEGEKSGTRSYGSHGPSIISLWDRKSLENVPKLHLFAGLRRHCKGPRMKAEKPV